MKIIIEQQKNIDKQTIDLYHGKINKIVINNPILKIRDEDIKVDEIDIDELKQLLW